MGKLNIEIEKFPKLHEMVRFILTREKLTFKKVLRPMIVGPVV